MGKKKLLEKKEWQYYVFEHEGHIELSVPTPEPAPGFDVDHRLNESEKEEYLRIGIKVLEDRMEDMRINSSNYKMSSWR